MATLREYKIRPHYRKTVSEPSSDIRTPDTGFRVTTRENGEARKFVGATLNYAMVQAWKAWPEAEALECLGSEPVE